MHTSTVALARTFTNSEAIVTRVTELKVEYTPPRASEPFTRVFVPYSPMNIVRRVLAKRAAAFAHDFSPHFVPLVSVSIAKSRASYFFRSGEIKVIYVSPRLTDDESLRGPKIVK